MFYPQTPRIWHPRSSWTELSEATQLKHIGYIHAIGADAWWLDADWFDGVPTQTGWPGSFPNGGLPAASAAHRRRTERASEREGRAAREAASASEERIRKLETELTTVQVGRCSVVADRWGRGFLATPSARNGFSEEN